MGGQAPAAMSANFSPELNSFVDSLRSAKPLSVEYSSSEPLAATKPEGVAPEVWRRFTKGESDAAEARKVIWKSHR